MRILNHLNKPSREILTDLLNRSSRLSLHHSDLQFAKPTRLVPETVPGINKNTRIKIRGIANIPGEKTFFYNRIDLGVLFGVEEAGVEELFETLPEALGFLNSTYGLGIDITEVDQSVVMANDRIDVIIKNSLVYIPGTKITIVSQGGLVWLRGAADEYYNYVHNTLYTDIMVPYD